MMGIDANLVIVALEMDVQMPRIGAVAHVQRFIALLFAMAAIVSNLGIMLDAGIIPNHVHLFGQLERHLTVVNLNVAVLERAWSWNIVAQEELVESDTMRSMVMCDLECHHQ